MVPVQSRVLSPSLGLANNYDELGGRNDVARTAAFHNVYGFNCG